MFTLFSDKRLYPYMWEAHSFSLCSASKSREALRYVSFVFTFPSSCFIYSYYYVIFWGRGNTFFEIFSSLYILRISSFLFMCIFWEFLQACMLFSSLLFYLCIFYEFHQSCIFIVFIPSYVFCAHLISWHSLIPIFVIGKPSLSFWSVCFPGILWGIYFWHRKSLPHTLFVSYTTLSSY